MPVHDGSKWVGAALESLAEQPSGQLEVIVIDSTPTSATADVVTSYCNRLQLHLHRRIDLKPWQLKTNLGVELASANHACILHQDDLWLPGRTGAILGWIAAAPDASLHLAPTMIIDQDSRAVGRWGCPLPAGRPLTTEFLLERLLVQNFIAVPAPVFSTRAWLECGGLDEALWYTPDWDIWVKLAGAGQVVYHDEVTTAFRVHGGSQTVVGSRDAGEFRAQMETVLNRHIHHLPAPIRRRMEPAARASININVSLAAASAGRLRAIFRALWDLASLGPAGAQRYLRDSRLVERVAARLRAKAAGAF
jgi:glycosyltransferase involved in cell wall biosynthesis